MRPFGETVLVWRLTRGMTQAQLAHAARIPRPNLSAIERGDREVTLRTLRSLALALDVRPGALVDGEMPAAGAPPLTRTQMERIAQATVHGRPLADPRESALARWLAVTLSEQLGSRGDTPSRRRPGERESGRAYFLLRAAEEPAVLASLVNRVVEKLPLPRS
jgi:transcriptional regulator with XRE-family HTH domain